MDTVSKKKRSEIMSRVKSVDSRIETSFRKELWRNGFRYGKNSSGYFGKPDILLKRYKTIIFIDSCFWHGCKKHCRMPASRKNYWLAKIKRNVDRDKIVSRYYRKNGWIIIRIWEHELAKKRPGVIRVLKKIKSGKDFDSQTRYLCLRKISV